jgi:cold shock CspA family protein
MTESVEAPIPAGSRCNGYIREWRDEGRGFGKIYARQPEAQKGESFFFHMSSVSNPRALAKGVKVQFDISPIQDGKHRRAVNVEVVG